MKIKTTIIVLCIVTQVLQTNGLIQLKNSLANSDSPLLKKILELVDAAINDEHLLQVTLKLLRSLCICMRETLRAKEDNFKVAQHPLELNEHSSTEGKVFDLYKNIYNNTCFNLRQDLTNHTYKFIVDEEDEFLNHTNCGKDERNETLDERDHSDDKSPAVQHSIPTRLEQVLYKTLILTKDLHEYRLRKYNLFGKGTPQTKSVLQNILIVILTLYPDKHELSLTKTNIDEKDFNNTIYTKSPIDIDLIGTEFAQRRKQKDGSIKADIITECNLQSLYMFLTESDRNNLIKVFKFIRKRNTIKIYTEVGIGQNHTDLINICCKNGTKYLQCKKHSINHFVTQPKFIDENYKNTITKIRNLVDQYENNLNDTTHRNATVEDEMKKRNIFIESTTKQSGTTTDRNEKHIHGSVTNSQDSSKLGEVTQAIVLLNDFVAKQTTKPSSQINTTNSDQGKYFVFKKERQDDATTIDIGTVLDAKDQQEKMKNESTSSMPLYKNSKVVSTGTYLPENLVEPTTSFKQNQSGKKDTNKLLDVTLPIFHDKHEAEKELRQTSTSKTDKEYLINKSYTVNSASTSNDLNTDLYTVQNMLNETIASQINITVTPIFNDNDNLLEFITPLPTTERTMIPDSGINQNKVKEYKPYFLGLRIKVDDISSTTIASREQNIATPLHYSPGMNLVSLTNNTELSTHLPTLIFGDGKEQTLHDAKNIFEMLILVNSTDVTKSIAESEPTNVSSTTEQSKPSVSNIIVNVISMEKLTKDENKTGQNFTLGESILDVLVKQPETKAFTSIFPELKNISETTTKTVFQKNAPNMTHQQLTTFSTLDFTELFNQSFPGYMEDIKTIERETKAESTNTPASYVMVEVPNEQIETSTFTIESLETNNITETTIGTTFRNIVANMTQEPITASSLNITKLKKQSFYDVMVGMNTIDLVTKADPTLAVLTKQTETKTSTSEYPEINSILDTKLKHELQSIATNTTLELTKLSTLGFSKSHNQPIHDDIEGINTVDSVTKAEVMNTFASNESILDDVVKEIETTIITSEFPDTTTISDTTIKATFQNIATNTTFELLKILPTLEFDSQAVLVDTEDINTTVTINKTEPMRTFSSDVTVLDGLVTQTETKASTLESFETIGVSVTSIKSTLQNITTKQTPGLLTTVPSFEFTKSDSQAVPHDLDDINSTDTVTEVEPLKTFASDVTVLDGLEQTEPKTITSESPTNTLGTTVRTISQSTASNMIYESLAALPILNLTKSRNQSVHDGIEESNTTDSVTKAEKKNPFASHIVVDEPDELTKTETITSESLETNDVSETTKNANFQKIATNMTLESLLTPDFTIITYNQGFHDDIGRINTTKTVTEADHMSTFTSHVTVEEPINHTEEVIIKEFTNNGLAEISPIETTFSQSTQDANDNKGMNAEMTDYFFSEGKPGNYTNDGNETYESESYKQNYITTGLPVTNEEEISSVFTDKPVVKQGTVFTLLQNIPDNEITMKSTNEVTSEELKMTTNVVKKEPNTVNTTLLDTFYINADAETNAEIIMTTALPVDTEKPTVISQETDLILFENVSDNEITTIRSTESNTAEDNFTMTTDYDKNEYFTFPDVITTKNVPNIDPILQSETVSTSNPPKSTNALDKQNNLSTALLETASSTEMYTKILREANTTFTTTSNNSSELIPKITSKNIRNTEDSGNSVSEAVATQTIFDSTDLNFFESNYGVTNYLERPEIQSVKTSTLSSNLVIKSNESSVTRDFENTSIVNESTTGAKEDIAIEIQEIMSPTTKIPFTKQTRPSKLDEKDTVQKETATEVNVAFNGTFEVTTDLEMNGISDEALRNNLKTFPEEELVDGKLLDKDDSLIPKTTLEESLKNTLPIKFNDKYTFQKDSGTDITFDNTFQITTDAGMEKMSDEPSMYNIEVPKEDSKAWLQDEPFVIKLGDNDVSPLSFTPAEEPTTMLFNSRETSLDTNLHTYTKSVLKGDNNVSEKLSNKEEGYKVESSSPYTISTEITPTDVPGFTREYTTMTAEDLFAEQYVTAAPETEANTTPENRTKQQTTDTFIDVLDSASYFTNELNNTYDMEVTSLGMITQDQTDELLTMPTSTIAIEPLIEPIQNYILNSEDMEKANVPVITTINHENVFTVDITTDRLISSPTNIETSTYFDNNVTSLTLANESSTENNSVIDATKSVNTVHDLREIIQDKPVADLKTTPIITTIEKSSALETLNGNKVPISQTFSYYGNTKEPITTASTSTESETTNIENDKNVARIKESNLFTSELAISDLVVLKPASLSSTEVIDNTTKNKQLITSEMGIEELTSFTPMSRISALRFSTPAASNSTEVMRNATINNEFTISDRGTVLISENPYAETTQYTSRPNSAITSQILGTREVTETEDLAELNDILTHTTSQLPGFTSQPFNTTDNSLDEEIQQSSMRTTTKELVKMQLHSEDSKITPVSDTTKSMINVNNGNASTESFLTTIANETSFSDVMHCTSKIFSKSNSTFTKGNKIYTEKAKLKRSKTLKDKIKSKKPIAFELNIRVGVEASKDGIKFSVLGEKETVIHEKPDVIILPSTTYFTLNQSADNAIKERLLKSDNNSANEIQNNSTISLTTHIKDNIIKNVDLSRITETLKKLSPDPPVNKKRRKKFKLPKHSKTRKSFGENTTIDEEIQQRSINTTSYNATMTSVYKNFTHIKHKSIIPGVLTEQLEINNISSIYKEQFEKFKESMNYTENGNINATNVIKKAMLILPETENMGLNISGVNNTFKTTESKEHIETSSGILFSAKNNLTQTDPRLIKNKISKTKKLIAKKLETMLKKLLKGKKISKNQLLMLKTKLLKNLTSKKNVTNVHKYDGPVKQKNNVNMTNDTVIATKTDNSTISKDNNITGIQKVEATSSSSDKNMTNNKTDSDKHNKTLSKIKIENGIAEHKVVKELFNTSKNILSARRLFDELYNKSLSFQEIEQESSKLKPETTYQNTTETISGINVTANTSYEEPSLSEIILNEVDDNLLRAENESILEPSETLNDDIQNSNIELDMAEVIKGKLSLFDSDYNNLLKEPNGVLTQQNSNKTSSFNGVHLAANKDKSGDDASSTMTDADNNIVITNTNNNSTATTYGISEEILTTPFQTTFAFNATGTTPLPEIKFENVAHHKFTNGEEVSISTFPMTTVNSNTFGKSEFQSNDKTTAVNFPLTITKVPPQINESNNIITHGIHELVTKIHDTKHYFMDDFMIPGQSEIDVFRRAENITKLIQKIDDVVDKYEEIETFTGAPSTSAKTNHGQDIISSTPNNFDILITYHPEAQSINVTEKSQNLIKAGNIHDTSISEKDSNYFSDTSITTNYFNTSTLNDEELRATEQMLNSFNTVLPENQYVSIIKTTATENNVISSTDIFKHITNSVDSTSTPNREIYKETDILSKNDLKQLRNKGIDKFAITNTPNSTKPTNVTMNIGEEIITCLMKKMSDEFNASSSIVQDLNTTTQQPIEEYFIDFTDNVRDNNPDFISTLATGKFVETATEIVEVSTTKLPLTQIPSNILEVEKLNEGRVHELQIINTTTGHYATTINNSNNRQLLYLADESGNVTRTETRNKTILSKSNVFGKRDFLTTILPHNTNMLQDKTSSNNTQQRLLSKVDDGEKNVSVISSPQFTHLKVTKMNPVNKTTVNLKLEVQKLVPVSSNKATLRTYQTNKNGTNGKRYESNYTSLFPNVRSGNFKSKKGIEIFSSRLNRQHISTTTTACTKSIKYNTYRPITKEELEILKYLSDPILNTVLHTQIDDKTLSQVAAVDNSSTAIESGQNSSQSDKPKTILRADNSSEAKQKKQAENQDHAAKDLHLALGINDKLNQSIEIAKIPHSSEINRISHPILEININSPQIRTNGNLPPMIEINGNPLPIEINRNSVPMVMNGNPVPMGMNGNPVPVVMNGNAVPLGMNGNSAAMAMNGNSMLMSMNGNTGPMAMNGNPAPMAMNGNSVPMALNGNSATMGMNGNSAPMGMNGNSAPMASNGNTGPMAMNGNPRPMAMNGNFAPMGMNGYFAPMGTNGNSAPMGINVNSASMGTNRNSASMGITGNSVSGNLLMMDIMRNPGPVRTNGSSMSIDEINKNSGPMATNGNSLMMDITRNSIPMRISGNSVTMNMNENSIPTDTKLNPVPSEFNTYLMPTGVNRNLVPDQNIVNSLPMGMNRIPMTIDINRNPLPKETNKNIVQVESNRNSEPIEIGRNPVMMEINNNRNPVNIDINKAPMPMVMNRNSVTMDFDRNSVPMDNIKNSAAMDTNRNPVTMDSNKTAVPTEINKTLVMTDTNRNPVLMDGSRNSESIGANRSSLPVKTELNNTLIPHKNNRYYIPEETNNNLVSSDTNRTLPKTFEISGNLPSKPKLAGNSPVTDSFSNIDKDLTVNNKNLSSTINKPWISASIFDNNGNSPATIDSNSNLPIFNTDQNSPLPLHSNKNLPSIIDINRYTLVVNKNSPTIVHDKWNLPSMMGNNKKALSKAAKTVYSINENKKSTSASGNNINTLSIDNKEESSKNMKNRPSEIRNQDNNKNSLSMVANSPPMDSLNLPSTMETTERSPLLSYFSRITHTTVKSKIILAETKTSKTVVAARKKQLPMKEIKRKPFLTFDNNKKPLSITGKKKNTHGALELNTHSKLVRKNFKTTGSQKEKLLNSFEDLNPYTAKIKEPNGANKRTNKQMKIGIRTRAVKTLNTQDFLSQRRNAAPQSVLQKTTKMFLKPQRSLPKLKTLRPNFSTIDKPVKRLEQKMKPKPVLSNRRSGQNIQRMLPKRTRINNVLDMPIRHSTLKSRFMNKEMGFMFNNDYMKVMKMTRRPALDNVLDSDFFGDNYNPSPSYRRSHVEQVTTEAARTRHQKRTIFFLSPTESYDQYE